MAISSICHNTLVDWFFEVPDRYLRKQNKRTLQSRLKLHHRILTLLIYYLDFYFSCILVRVRARNLILGACIIYLFIYLFKLRVHLVCLITS